MKYSNDPAIQQRAMLFRYAIMQVIQQARDEGRDMTSKAWPQFLWDTALVKAFRLETEGIRPSALPEPCPDFSSCKCLNCSTHRFACIFVRTVGNHTASSPTTSQGDASSASLRGLAKVAGMHTLKKLLRDEVVEAVSNPEPYRRYGLSVPNGILLYGPPGCGKTYIARHLAEELGHHFIEVIPSELASPWMHGSTTRIRELFDKAVASAPTVMFIDEFEAMVPERKDLGSWQQWKAEEVNELLTHLNRAAEKRIFIIAASNEPQKIDSAMLRTGRLDKHIYVGPPDCEARKEMLALHLAGRPVAGNLDLDWLAKKLEGYSASDIRFLVDEAARRAMRVGGDIGSVAFLLAIGSTPRSCGAETESRYRQIKQRGL